MDARSDSRPPRVALVHDFLLDLRGAERVFLEMCDLWPDAPIFTAVYDEEGTEGRFAHRDVRTSFLQRLRPNARTFRSMLPFYPAAIESLDLAEFDVVVSSSSAWAHAVICDEGTAHVSYCHNPFRYAWNDRDRTLAECRDPVRRAALRTLFHRWRQWDWIAAQRVDTYLANSRTTQARIRAYFGRDARVVYPPVEVSRFNPGSVGDHYMVLSELMPHKRIDLAVEAFNRLRLPLVVAGDGPDARRLPRMAGPTVTLTRRLSDAERAPPCACTGAASGWPRGQGSGLRAGRLRAGPSPDRPPRHGLLDRHGRARGRAAGPQHRRDQGQSRARAAQVRAEAPLEQRVPRPAELPVGHVREPAQGEVPGHEQQRVSLDPGERAAGQRRGRARAR